MFEPVSEALLEEMFSDLELLTARLEQFGDRWGKYGDALEHRLTTDQRRRLEAAFNRALARLKELSDG